MFAGSAHAKHRAHVAKGRAPRGGAAAGLPGGVYSKYEARGTAKDKLVIMALSILVIVMLGSLLYISRTHRNNQVRRRRTMPRARRPGPIGARARIIVGAPLGRGLTRRAHRPPSSSS